MTTDINNNKQLFWVASSLAIIILGFNSLDIFYTYTMYVDDHHRYILGLENKLHTTIFDRNSIRAYVIFPLYKLLSIDPTYARLAQVVIFYIPLSFTFYILYKKYAKLPHTVAFVASIIPCILPGQNMIPSFIDGSYTIQGLLIFNLTLLTSIHFLQHNNKKPLIYYTAIAVLYATSLEMMDHSIFLMPFAITLFVITGIKNKNLSESFIVSSIFLILAIAKTYYIIKFPTVSASIPIEPSWDIFLSRFEKYIITVIPFSYNLKGQALNSSALLFIFTLITSSAYYITNKTNRILILLGLLWAFLSIITFLTFSKYYSSRYAHISGFGINFVLIYSIYLLVNAVYESKKYKKQFLITALASILIFAGISRMIHIYKINVSRNNAHIGITIELAKLKFSKNSQIVILNGNRIATGGWWIYSSGYIKYASGRTDLNGLIGTEYYYYNPFIKEKRGYNKDNNMNGLDIQLPIYIFKLNCSSNTCFLKQYEYALSWKKESWSVYNFNTKTGKLIKTIEGISHNNFIKITEQKGLKVEDIAFAK